MRPLWLRWVLLLLFVAILGTAFVNLGQWQLRRLHEREVRNATTLINESRPPVPFSQVFDHPIVDADQWQRVQARGTFDAEHQFIVRYRKDNDDRGYEVITPLHTDSGQTVLVDRGFIAMTGSEFPDAAPPPPAGEVTLVGHVRRSENGKRGAIQPDDGQVRLINAPAIGATLPYPVLDGYIGVLSMKPAQQGEFRPISVPELSNGPHFWYAVQWFMFTGIAGFGLVVFIRSDVRDRRAAKAAAAKDPENAGPHPVPDGRKARTHG